MQTHRNKRKIDSAKIIIDNKNEIICDAFRQKNIQPDDTNKNKYIAELNKSNMTDLSSIKNMSNISHSIYVYDENKENLGSNYNTNAQKINDLSFSYNQQIQENMNYSITHENDIHCDGGFLNKDICCNGREINTIVCNNILNQNKNNQTKCSNGKYAQYENYSGLLSENREKKHHKNILQLKKKNLAEKIKQEIKKKQKRKYMCTSNDKKQNFSINDSKLHNNSIENHTVNRKKYHNSIIKSDLRKSLPKCPSIVKRQQCLDYNNKLYKTIRATHDRNFFSRQNSSMRNLNSEYYENENPINYLNVKSVENILLQKCIKTIHNTIQNYTSLSNKNNEKCKKLIKIKNSNNNFDCSVIVDNNKNELEVDNKIRKMRNTVIKKKNLMLNRKNNSICNKNHKIGNTSDIEENINSSFDIDLIQKEILVNQSHKNILSDITERLSYKIPNKTNKFKNSILNDRIKRQNSCDKNNINETNSPKGNKIKHIQKNSDIINKNCCIISNGKNKFYKKIKKKFKK